METFLWILTHSLVLSFLFFSFSFFRPFTNIHAYTVNEDVNYATRIAKYLQDFESWKQSVCWNGARSIRGRFEGEREGGESSVEI